MPSLQPCGACKSLEIEETIAEICATLKSGHPTGLRDREDLEESSQLPWHSGLSAVLESSENCVLCRLVLQGLRESRLQLVEDTRNSGDWAQPPKDFDDDIVTIPYYSNAAPKVAIQAWSATKFEKENSLISSKGNAILKAHAVIHVTCGGGIPTKSSWDGYEYINCEFRISSIDGIFHTGIDIDRTSQKDPASQEVFQLLNFWMSTCSDSHEKCSKYLRSSSILPTRVLNIKGADTDFVYLEESNVKANTTQPYAALSHCWGSSQPFTTTSETLEERKEGIRISALPQTYQDAIAVSRTLGLQYLWIDSLCIIQNDKQDWEQEAAKMAAVYRDASVVIGASNSSADSEGFLHERQLEFASINRFHASLLPPKAHRLTSESEPLKDEPLNSRAWTLQERYLPRRMISYGGSNVFWECSEMVASEDGYCIPRDGDRLALVTKTAAVELSVCGITGRSPGETDDTNYFDWYETVKEYKKRNITKSIDRLPALAGLAKAVAEQTGDKYLAGIWKKGLIEGLLWCKAEDKDLTRPDYRAPSWSWASVDGLVNFPVYNYYDRCVWKYMVANFEFTASYADSFFEPSSEDLFGGLKSGWLRLNAPLFPITSTRSWDDDVDYHPPEMIMDPLQSPVCDRVFEIKLPRKKKHDKVWLDGGFDIEEGVSDDANLFALLLARLPYPDSDGDRYMDIRFGLILQLTGSKDEYKRVGIIDGSVKIHKSSLLSKLQGKLYLEPALYKSPKVEPKLNEDGEEDEDEEQDEEEIQNLLGPDPYEGLEQRVLKIV